MTHPTYIRWLKDIRIEDIGLVGGKNASLGEMFSALLAEGVNIPNGFAITSDAYWTMLEQQDAKNRIRVILSDLNTNDLVDLKTCGRMIRELILNLRMPSFLVSEIRKAYGELCKEHGPHTDVAVRSSATAEDLPGASFAGQQETFLNVRGETDLLYACQRCFASLFTDRAISYRVDKGFEHLSVGLSIGVQKMVRSDQACSGVMFSLDTETGFRDVVLINGAYGLGENVVKGIVTPDEYCVFKPTLAKKYRPIISKSLGSKKIKMIYQDDSKHPTVNIRVPKEKREQFVLSDDEILILAEWACLIERYYSNKEGRSVPMDIEWAKDGQDGKLYIVQARPETAVAMRDQASLTRYVLKEKSELLVTGRAIGQKIGSGPVNIIRTPRDLENFEKGQVLVTETTDPDWEPLMKMAAGIVTDRGGRTSHAAIVSRELGIPCIVGCGDATEKIAQGLPITVSCAEGDAGKVYRGLLPYDISTIAVKMLPPLRTKITLNIGSPDNAFELSFLPNDGVGLVRIEFTISTSIRVHPRALIEFDSIEDKTLRHRIDELTVGYSDKRDYFVERLAQGIGKIAAAFYPKPVIVRTSDFKSNEYRHLLGGELYEPEEENPMLGWRGASRYYHPDYRQGFALECQALKKVRGEYGLSNVKIMIPFCRTVEEARKVIDVMKDNGLRQGEDGLEVYCMCEVPTNVLLAEEFLDVFDGYSIGSNDLTQLTLGLDRDSSMIAGLFDESNAAVLELIQSVIETAKHKKKYIGICGDAPSSFPEFASLLVKAGISAISVSPDAVQRIREVVAIEEAKMQ